MPVYEGDTPGSGTVKGYALVCLGTLGLAACMTVLFLGMRGAMELGGFVATGGPYVIEHRAPTWIWVVPVSILSGVAFIAIQGAGAKSLGGFNLVMPMWVGLFFSLGGNFLDFGFRAGTAGIAWIVCGVMFWAMAILPLFQPIMAAWNPALGGTWMAFPGGGMCKGSAGFGAYVAVHLVAAAAGVAAGIALFSAVS